MRKLLMLFISVAFISGCGPSQDDKASKYLDDAKASLEQGNYTKAKLQIDSIKLLYPKAFETRKAGIRLMLTIEQEEQLRGLVYLDSLEQAKLIDFESIKSKYKLEKDENYQEIGNYIMPTQTIERNINKTYLRFQVNELGVMSMTSIYSAPRGLGHHTIKVATSDGSFAQTPASTDTFVSTNLGITTEKSDYKLGADGDVIPFVVNNNDQKITVTFMGDKNHSYTLSPVEKKAAVEISELASTLHTLTEIQKAKQEANLKLRFVEKRMAHNDSVDSQEKK